MLNTVIGECGDIWLRCHQEAEVRRMRDVHLNTIIKRREGLEECETACISNKKCTAFIYGTRCTLAKVTEVEVVM